MGYRVKKEFDCAKPVFEKTPPAVGGALTFSGFCGNMEFKAATGSAAAAAPRQAQGG